MPRKILLVDDEEQIRKLVGTFLDRRGYSVRTARNGAEALRLISEDPPDLVVTDVAMPDVDGLALTQQLRAGRLTARLPIIMLSAHKETSDMLAGYDAGADEYVQKPIELAILGAKVDTILNRTNADATGATEQRGIVSVFVHGKGGVGTTTLAVNTAISLAESTQSSVAVLDLNLGFANAELLLDVQPGRRLDNLALFDFRQMEPASFSEFLTPHSSGVAVLAGPASPELAENITPAMVEFTIERLRRQIAHVVIDLPASFSEINVSAIDLADMVCVVTSSEIAALKATRECLRITEKLHVVSHERTLVALNRTTPKGLPDDKVSEFLGRRIEATIPYDPQFRESADEGRPFVTAYRLRPGRKAIVQLAERIAECKVQKQDTQKRSVA